MAVVLIGGKVEKDDLKNASEEYGLYVKVTADLSSKMIAVGGEWHADGEKVLLEKGSKRSDIWGGGINTKTGRVDFNALINLKPGINESMEILDMDKRADFEKLVKEKFGI